MTPKTKPSTLDLSDDQLMERLERGEVEDSLATLQRPHGPRIFKLIRSIVQDDHQAQDLVQETFIKVFFKSHLYRIGTNFRSWLSGIARNQSLSALRTRKHTPSPVSNLSSGFENRDGDFFDQFLTTEQSRVLEEREIMFALEQAVQDLPLHYREVFEKCVRRGISYRQAADDLQIPPGTVAIRISRARRRLFHALTEYLDTVRHKPACVL